MAEEASLWTVLGAVGALGGGGFVGSFVAHRLREKATRRREERERTGLLRLLLVEVEQNQRQLRALRLIPGWITKVPPDYLRWGVWEDTRVRLAQLLEEEEKFADFARCYDMIQQIAAYLLTADTRDEQEVVQGISDRVPTAIERCQKAAEHIRQYVPEAPAEPTCRHRPRC